jgi:hypothetical protein
MKPIHDESVTDPQHTSRSASDAAAEPGRSERGRRFLALGAALSAVGVAIAGTAAPSLGGICAVAGWLVFVAGLHLFGRAGGSQAP